MKFIVSLLVSALSVMLASYLLEPHISVDGFGTALGVAIVLGLLNAFVRPILTILTLPITIVTLGLFLLVINVLMIKLTAGLIGGFHVENWLWALIFSFLMSVLTSVGDSIVGSDKDKKDKD